METNTVTYTFRQNRISAPLPKESLKKLKAERIPKEETNLKDSKNEGKDVDEKDLLREEAAHMLRDSLGEREEDFPSKITSLDNILIDNVAEVLKQYNTKIEMKETIKEILSQNIKELRNSGRVPIYKDITRVCKIFLEGEVKELINGYSAGIQKHIIEAWFSSAFQDEKDENYNGEWSYAKYTKECFSDPGVREAVEYCAKYPTLINKVISALDHVYHEKGIEGAQFMAECLCDKRFEKVIDKYIDIPEVVYDAILDKMEWMIEEGLKPKENAKDSDNAKALQKKNKIINAIQWFLDEDVQKAIDRHKNDPVLLECFAEGIGWFVSQTFDKRKNNLILLPAKYLLDENLIKSFENYKGRERIIAHIAVCAGYLQSEEATAVIIDTAKSCPDLAAEYVDAMREIFFTPDNRDFMCTGGLMEGYRELTGEIADCIKKYAHSPKFMSSILTTFTNASDNGNIHAAVKYFKDKEVTQRIIDKYGENEMAREILDCILNYAADWNVKRKDVITCTKLLLSEGVKYSDVAGIGRRLPEVHYIERVIKNLDILVDEEGTFPQKLERAKIYKSMREFDIKIDKPNMSNAWMEECKNKATENVKKVYGNAQAVLDLKMDELMLLLQIGKESNESTKLSDEDKKWIIYVAAEKKWIKKIFPAGKEYANIKISNTVGIEADSAELARCLATGILSNSKREGHFGNLKNALRFYPIEKLRAARSFVERSNPGKVFSEIKKEFTALKDKKCDPELRGESAQKLRAYLKDLAEKGKTKDKNPEDAEALSDLVDMAEGIERKTIFDSIVVKMQSGDMTDITDNRDIMCCAFYPTGAYKKASLQYLLDPAIGLLWLRAANAEGKETQNVGVVILVSCIDKKGNKILLVDSVEGGEALQSIKENWMENVYNSILSAAKDVGAAEVVFNACVANSTPKKFNDFLEGKGLEIRRKYLDEIRNKEGSKRYLEAFPGVGFCPPVGNVEGYIVKIVNAD